VALPPGGAVQSATPLTAASFLRSASPVRAVAGPPEGPADAAAPGQPRRATSPLRVLNAGVAEVRPRRNAELQGDGVRNLSSMMRSGGGAAPAEAGRSFSSTTSGMLRVTPPGGNASVSSHGVGSGLFAGSPRYSGNPALGSNLSQAPEKWEGAETTAAAASVTSPADAAIVEAPSRPCGAPPFYWVPAVDAITEFEVSGAAGEVVSKTGDYEDKSSALPIAGTLRMAKGGLYLWTLQVVRQCPRRPHLQFGLHGANHARPWRLVSTGRCSRSRDDGPWLVRPGGDLLIGEGDYVHCEADLRGVHGPLGTFSFAVNDGPFETVFEDIPLSEGPLQPVVAMGGSGTTCRLCPA